MLKLIFALTTWTLTGAALADVPPGRIPPPPEVLCAASLSSLAPHYLIQNSDVADQIEHWHLSSGQRASLARDLENKKVHIAVARLRGKHLLAFLGRWERTVDDLDDLVLAERDRVAAGFVTPRPWARTLKLALAAGAIGVSQHWGAQLAGQIVLVASLLEAKMAYHRHTYLRPDKSLARILDLSRVGRVRTTRLLADIHLKLATRTTVLPQTIQFEGRLNKSLVRALSVPRATPLKQMTAGVSDSVDVARQWGWLDPVLPGRRRVLITMNVETDASGAPVLTVVSRVKRW